MQPNERLKKGAREIMLFPGTSWSCAQYWGPGTYSHCCGYPLDWTGGDLYAPCTVRSAGCIDPATNCELWYSTDAVWVPGEKNPVYIAFQVGHSESMRGTGTVVPQGGYLNSMGTVMNGHSGGCGLHAHIEFVILGESPGSTGFVNGGCAGVISAAGSSSGNSVGSLTKGASSCFNLTNSRPYYEVCFMNDTNGDTGSSYAQHHQYAKGLSWFVPAESRSLMGTDEELYNNMRCVYGFFKCLNEIENLNALYQAKATAWTDGAIAGLLANMQNESSVNPNRWEGDTPYGTTVGGIPGGYGLVQWTPYTNIINVLKIMTGESGQPIWTEKDSDPTVLGNAECQQIFAEYCQGQQWIAVDGVSWETWAHSDAYDSASGASTAAMIFQQDYERPFKVDPNRGVLATQIYQKIKDENWDKEMPAGMLKAEIINPWDLATVVEDGIFKVKKDFIPVYWCPRDPQRKEAITFEFRYYLFVKDGILPYERVYFGPGGFPAEDPEKAIVTTWFAWGGNQYGHYFAPSVNAITESQAIFLAPYKRTGNELEINKDFFEAYFPLEEKDNLVEKPYNKKVLFKSDELPVYYDLLQIGSYDERGKKIRTSAEKIRVWGEERNADDTFVFLSKNSTTSHFVVDSNKIIQMISLDRQVYTSGAYVENVIDIHLTNTTDNNNMELVQSLIAELYYFGYVKNTNSLDSVLSLNVATNMPFNASSFKSGVIQKIQRLRQQSLNKEQSKILAKIKSQKRYETYWNRIGDILNKKEWE